RERMKIEVPLRVLFEEPRLEGFAKYIEDELRPGVEEGVPGIERVRREGVVKMSFAQERLWFLDQLAINSQLYIIPYVGRVEGEMNEEAFRESLNEVVRRHEVLRTAYKMEGGMGVQEVKEEGEVEEGAVDLRGLEEEEREEVIRRQGVRERERRFDLGEGGGKRGRGGGRGGGGKGGAGGGEEMVGDGGAG